MRNTKYIIFIFIGLAIMTIQYCWVIAFIDHRIDLKILTHTLHTPATSYEEIVSIINDTVVSGAIITEYIEE